MTSEHWTERLSEYLDGELDAPEREACAAHLEECDRCAATLEDLRSVTSRAAVLPDLPPERDLWPDIESRLPPRTVSVPVEASDVVALPQRRRRVVLTVPQLIAAVIALVLFSAGSVWLALPGAGPAPGGEAAERVAGAPDAAGPAMPVALTAYDEAVSELEAVFEERRDELDPETIRVVVANLAIIDRAIAEARDALRSDPSSGFLNAHLAGAMRQKVDLLRQVTTIERTES